MAWNITGSVNVNWVPEGAGSQTLQSGQTENLTIQGPQGSGSFIYPPVAIAVSTEGTLTAAQVNTACSTFGSLMASYFGTTTLSTLQGWSTGNP